MKTQSPHLKGVLRHAGQTIVGGSRGNGAHAQLSDLIGLAELRDALWFHSAHQGCTQTTASQASGGRREASGSVRVPAEVAPSCHGGLTSRHDGAHILQREHRQLLLGVHPDHAVTQVLHGQDAAARGRRPFLQWPVESDNQSQWSVLLPH